MARLTATDPEVRMPYHGPPLPPEQIALLKRWIQQGAKWQDYWAFEAPKSDPLPEVKNAGWVRQPLDRFILARLEKEGLQPSPEASKAELLRRASFDLTGLPPTEAEQAAFLADTSANAYEKQVDRLLASPRYGERWAATWLDLARYADTKGYEKDATRAGVWPYRDWVIEAYNRNVPYDHFVITQLAGDLLPHATFEDRIATSFHRQTPSNDEGGTDDEEFRLAAVMDRVATTWSVLNGVTMNCVQCHSHPYDPIRHADYYKSIAFFNTQRDADLLDDSPTMRVPTDKARYAEVAGIEEQNSRLLREVEESDRDIESKTAWKALPIEAADANEVEALTPLLPKLEKQRADAVKNPKLDPKKRKDTLTGIATAIDTAKKSLERAKVAGPAKTFTLRDGEAWTNADAPSISFYEYTAKANLPVITALRVEVPPLNADNARHSPEAGFIVDKMQGWVVGADGQKSKVEFRYFAQDSETNLDAALAALSDPKRKDPDVPSLFAAMARVFRTRWIVCVPAAPLRMAASSRLQIDLAQTKNIDDKPALVQRVRLSVSGDPAWTAMTAERAPKVARLVELRQTLGKIPTVGLPVMVEQQPYEQRATKEFDRGNFLNKIGPDLQPDVPGIFPKFPQGVPRNRLTLAQWFFQPGQPLTARVAVNRYWEELYGTGLVETLENFGSVGEAPSNQALLDWMALHFQNDLHWDMKALLREIVTSATYRQSATATPALLARDPRNRLLARGPQQRLTAEMVRDQALVASGLLNTTMGGPPVMPPQPAGIWNSVYNDAKWTDAVGPNRYRRAIYTFIKRTAGYPSSLIFDASDRDVSLPRRIATNTPLQALVTFNDPVYQETAAALARRVVAGPELKRVRGGEAELDERLIYETRLVLSREPTEKELAVLRKAYLQALGVRDGGGVVKAGFAKGSLGRGVSSSDARGFAVVGSILFNLDAALVR